MSGRRGWGRRQTASVARWRWLTESGPPRSAPRRPHPRAPGVQSAIRKDSYVEDHRSAAASAGSGSRGSGITNEASREREWARFRTAAATCRPVLALGGLGSVALQFVVQGLGADAQNLRRARFVAARKLDRAQDEFLLHIVEAGPQDDLDAAVLCRRSRLKLIGKVALRDNTAAADDQRALDHIA